VVGSGTADAIGEVVKSYVTSTCPVSTSLEVGVKVGGLAKAPPMDVVVTRISSVPGPVYVPRPVVLITVWLNVSVAVNGVDAPTAKVTVGLFVLKGPPEASVLPSTY
jgi:hypothetical protein